MTVFLGAEGGVEIRRFVDGDEPIVGTLTPEDLNLNNNTFAHPFHTPKGPFTTELSPFISGDRVRVTRIDKNLDGSKKDLVLIKDAKPSKSQEFYVAVGVDGRLQCYAQFEDAIMKRDRLQLVQHTEDQRVRMTPTPGVGRCLANVTSYEFTTDRETVDTTSLGSEFREYYSRGLISGQGSLQCLWNYRPQECVKDDGIVSDYPHYLLNLVQRVTFQLDVSAIGIGFNIDELIEGGPCLVELNASLLLTVVLTRQEPEPSVITNSAN